MLKKLLIENTKYKSILYFIYVASIIILAISVIDSPKNLIADEQYFYPNIAYLHSVGLSKFIMTYLEQAPGPLYQFVHYCTYLLTNSIIYVRVDNLIFALLNILLISLILKNKNIKDSLLISLVYISIPLAWVHSGTAITETPTIFFTLLFFFFLSNTFDKTKASITDVFVMSACVTCAVMGRSTFLTVIFAIFIFFFYIYNQKKYFLLSVGVLSLIIPMYVFYLWKGLTPPGQAFLSKGGLSFYHLMLMVAYLGIILFIMYPNAATLIHTHYKIFFPVLLLIFILFLFVSDDILIPMQTIKVNFKYLKYLIITVYSISSAFFIVACYTNFREEKEHIFLIIFLFSILLAGTAVKITNHFSAGYAFQAAPFLILIYRKYFRKNLLQILFGIIGIVLGYKSLHGYYVFHY